MSQAPSIAGPQLLPGQQLSPYSQVTNPYLNKNDPLGVAGNPTYKTNNGMLTLGATAPTTDPGGYAGVEQAGQYQGYLNNAQSLANTETAANASAAQQGGILDPFWNPSATQNAKVVNGASVFDPTQAGATGSTTDSANSLLNPEFFSGNGSYNPYASVASPGQLAAFSASPAGVTQAAAQTGATANAALGAATGAADNASSAAQTAQTAAQGNLLTAQNTQAQNLSQQSPASGVSYPVMGASAPAAATSTASAPPTASSTPPAPAATSTPAQPSNYSQGFNPWSLVGESNSR